MSSQINNNYTTALTSPSPYITRKLNNMNLVQEIKKEREDWTRLYHKILKGLEMMINVQKMVKDIKKLTEEANMTLTEVEGTILAASINNQMVNATNIAGISEDLQHIIQSDMEDQVFQTQRMLADELNVYKGKEQRKSRRRESYTIKPYEVSESSLTKSSSFVDEEVNNLLKYMKFIKSPT